MSYVQTFNQVVRHLRARTPLLNVVADCERVCDLMIPGEIGRNGLVELPHKGAAKGAPAICLVHDCVSGLYLDGFDLGDGPGLMLRTPSMDHVKQFLSRNAAASLADLLAPDGGRQAPLYDLCEKLRQTEGDPKFRLLLLVHDMHRALDDDLGLRRQLLIHAKRENVPTVALVTPDAVEDAVLRTYMPVIQAERPSRQELYDLVARTLAVLCGEPGLAHKRGKTPAKATLELQGTEGAVTLEAAAEACSGCLSGLHAPTALQILFLHLETPGCVAQDDKGRPLYRINPAALSREKAEILNKAGYVSLINNLVGESEVGGLDDLKNWLKSRRAGFTPEAAVQKLRFPRGVLLVGPPGTAKSTCAKMAASMFGMPLLRLDVGALFNSLLGNSERNARNALQVADASSPCVLWLDEVAV